MDKGSKITYAEFMSSHYAKPTLPCTHTCMNRGKYCIPDDALETFYDLYIDDLYVHKHTDKYLTEAQLEIGPLVVDLDFRYPYHIRERQYIISEHILPIIEAYMNIINDLCIVKEEEDYPVYIFEKDNVNPDEKHNYTKDGVHLIFSLSMPKILREFIRECVLEALNNHKVIIDIPELITSWEDIIDVGIAKGSTAWTLYGSRKPEHDPYKLTTVVLATIDENDNGCRVCESDELFDEFSINHPNFKQSFRKLSVRYKHHVQPQMRPQTLNRLQNISNKSGSKKNNGALTSAIYSNSTQNYTVDYNHIVDKEALAEAVEKIMSNLPINERYIYDIHRYTEILPEKYWKEGGSHEANHKVAFALHNTDKERLFLSWVTLRAKDPSFSYDSISKLKYEWDNYYNINPNKATITQDSIIYWAKTDAFDNFITIQDKCLEHYIANGIKGDTDWDHANVLYQLLKHKYVCSSADHPMIWWIFNGNTWTLDKRHGIKVEIPTTLVNLYLSKRANYMNIVANEDIKSEDNTESQNYAKKISSICNKLKNKAGFERVSSTASLLFINEKFIELIDANPNLIGFSNGIYDFGQYREERGEYKVEREPCFRPGRPDDYVSMTTGYDYVPLSPYNQEIQDEINTFMHHVYPIERLCEYMWDYFATIIHGTKKNQAFHIFKGGGRNGKTKIMNLLKVTLNDYRKQIKSDLITGENNNKMGQASPELYSLKYARFVEVEEPKQNNKIDDGIVKQITGGGNMTARNLFAGIEEFPARFSLAITTNNSLNTNSTDDGLWRRLKDVPHMSYFDIHDGYKLAQEPLYTFEGDPMIEEKFPIWAPVFMSMLIERYNKTHGMLVDCPEVTESTQNYRSSQDSYMRFITDMTFPLTGPVSKDNYINKRLLSDQFKEWSEYNVDKSFKTKININDLYTAISNKYGKPKGGGNNMRWTTFGIRQDTTDPNEEVVEEGHDIIESKTEDMLSTLKTRVMN